MVRNEPAVIVTTGDDRTGVVLVTDDGARWYATDAMALVDAVQEANRYYVRQVGAFDNDLRCWSADELAQHFSELHRANSAPDGAHQRVYDLSDMDECELALFAIS